MDDRPTRLPWRKNFWLDTPRTDSSLRRINKRMWRYPSVPIPPAIDTENRRVVELFILRYSVSDLAADSVPALFSCVGSVCGAQFLHTARDQKLEAGTAWERG